MRESPARSALRLSRKRIPASGKSSPITPTTCTSQKQDAAAVKKVADPPRASSALPKGVSTVSRATLPTTRRDIGSGERKVRHSREGGNPGLGQQLLLPLHPLRCRYPQYRQAIPQNDLDRPGEDEARP